MVGKEVRGVLSNVNTVRVQCCWWMLNRTTWRSSNCLKSVFTATNSDLRMPTNAYDAHWNLLREGWGIMWWEETDMVKYLNKFMTPSDFRNDKKSQTIFIISRHKNSFIALPIHIVLINKMMMHRKMHRMHLIVLQFSCRLTWRCISWCIGWYMGWIG